MMFLQSFILILKMFILHFNLNTIKLEEFASMFHQILLQIFQKLNKERTISAAYHVLRGKRSGQTIQDIGLFQLHQYFGLLPKLSRTTFDEAVNLFMQNSWLNVQESGHFTWKRSDYNVHNKRQPFSLMVGTIGEMSMCFCETLSHCTKFVTSSRSHSYLFTD